MILEIIKFELKYRASKPETYLFFIVLILSSMVAVDIIFEGALGKIKTNAPYIIAMTMAIQIAFFTVITSLIMGMSILRDFNTKMESLIYVLPITKFQYLVGRFIGSFITLVCIGSGVMWGLMLSDFMPWRLPDELLPFNFWNYLQPFILMVLPTLFATGTIFFISGALSKKLLVVYTQGILFFMFYIIAMILSSGVENQLFSSLLDPFSFQTIKSVVKFWTPITKNSSTLPIGGILLQGRLLWILIGIIVFLLGYKRFDFSILKKRGKKKGAFEESKTSRLLNTDHDILLPKVFGKWNFRTTVFQVFNQANFTFKNIINEWSFWAIVISGMSIIFINAFNMGMVHGVASLPLTYVIVEEFQELSVFFFIIILVFYSGEIIWKERDIKLNYITDAMPISNYSNLAGKYIGMLCMYAFLLLAFVFSGIIFQSIKGYFNFEPQVYLSGFFLGVFPFLAIYTAVAFFIQCLVNNKFVSHLLLILFFALNIVLAVLGFDHPLLNFAGGTMPPYSDMNGHSHLLIPYLGMKIYWFVFGVLLMIIGGWLLARGTETEVKQRIKLAASNFNKKALLAMVSVALLLISMAYGIYYESNINHIYASSDVEENHRANYEKDLKKYEYIIQPKVTDINLALDLYPKERSYQLEGSYLLMNKDSSNINEVFVQIHPGNEFSLEHLNFSAPTTIDLRYEKYSMYIYKLVQPLLPGHCIKMEFKQSFKDSGTLEGSNFQVIENGTFINNDHFPSFGYTEKIELEDVKIRHKHGLEIQTSSAKRDDQRELMNGKNGDDGYKINFEMVVSTEIDQTAVAPGKLLKEWKENNRAYFHYQMDKPMVNFYSIVSARYEKLNAQWKKGNSSVDLEIYHHKEHQNNLSHMLKTMKLSLDYFTANFGPYNYDHLRIMEFPRYRNFAQSFPATIPFSESMGFVMDINEDAVDMLTFITAHEISHQWWGLHVVAANVEGKDMILESLAQYSAIMILKGMYSEEKMQSFLKISQDKYLRSRAFENKMETTLVSVSGQEYIYYDKGAINFCALQTKITEEKVNQGLKQFIEEWNFIDGTKQDNRYATTHDLMKNLNEVTPDSLKYLLPDLFENIIVYENVCRDLTVSHTEQGGSKLKVIIESNKYQVDSTGKENEIQLNEWMDLGIYGKGKNEVDSLYHLQKCKITNYSTMVDLDLDFMPTKVVVDPYITMIDKNPENNKRMVKIK